MTELKSFPDDNELVERVRKDDTKAFDMLYYKYSGGLYRFGLKYLKSSADTEELVQSVFVNIWENRRRLNKELSFKSYLFTIAYNDICKLFRRNKYFRKFVADTCMENPQQSHRIDEAIGFKSILERVKQIINTLPGRQRAIFLKSREEGKTSREIAAELEITTGTVDNYISGALKLIRHRLANEELVIALTIIYNLM